MGVLPAGPTAHSTQVGAAVLVSADSALWGGAQPCLLRAGCCLGWGPHCNVPACPPRASPPDKAPLTFLSTLRPGAPTQRAHGAVQGCFLLPCPVPLAVPRGHLCTGPGTLYMILV